LQSTDLLLFLSDLCFLIFLVSFFIFRIAKIITTTTTDKTRRLFAAEKERKKSKSKHKGEAFGKKFNLKDKYIKNNDKNVNSILELCSDSGESSCFVSSCSSNNFSDSENETQSSR
jgi:hypothetical protein